MKFSKKSRHCLLFCVMVLPVCFWSLAFTDRLQAETFPYYPIGTLSSNPTMVISPYHPDKPPVPIRYNPPPSNRMRDPYYPEGEDRYFLVPQHYQPTEERGRVSQFKDMAPRWPGTLRLQQDYENSESLLNRMLHGKEKIRVDDKQMAYDTPGTENDSKELPPNLDSTQNGGQGNPNSKRVDDLSRLLLFNNQTTREGKEPVLLSETRTGPLMFLAGGWQSADVYRDIDKTSEAGFPSTHISDITNVHRTSIWYSKAGVSYNGFAAVITYLQSEDKIIPRVSGVKAFQSGKPLPAATYYNEFDASVNYTYSFRRLIDCTIGYNLFAPLDRNFYGTNIDGEAFGTITLTAIPYLRPSVTYSLFNSAAPQLRGQHIEMRLDTVNFARFNYKSIHAEFDPFVSFGVDDGLVGDGIGFSAAIIGLKVPIQVAEHVIITANGNYGLPINESGPNFRTDVGKLGVWGGVALTVEF